MSSRAYVGLAILGVFLVAIAFTAVGSDQTRAAKEPDVENEYIKVEVAGTLRHGIVAIGGETTGTTITADGVTWELDLGRNAELARKAEQLDGQLVLVTGTLHVRPGVEIAKRWIVEVERLRGGQG